MTFLLNPKDIWQYDHCEGFDFKQQTFQSYKSKGNLGDDFKYFYEEVMQSAIHPSIKKSGLLSQEWEEVKSFTFNNIKVDQNTIKILFYFTPKTKIVTIKFSNNNFSLKNFELLVEYLFTTPNNIFNFSFEWNNTLIDENGEKFLISDSENRQKLENEAIDNSKYIKANHVLLSLFETTPDNRLEAISLRGCYLGSKVVSEIFMKLKNNTSLRILNLYKNNLTNECSKDFCEMVLLNRHLEEINLGGNNLSDAFITNLKNYIGEYEMTPEEIEEHEIKVKEKEEILLFNQKNKNNKKVELKEIPFVDEVIKQEDKFIKVRNNTLRKIDFMLNNLTQKSFDDISYILEHNKELIVVLDLMKYNKETIEKIIDPNGPYLNQIFLAK